MHNDPNYSEIFRSTPVRFVLPLKPELSKENLVKLPETTAQARYLCNGKILVKPEKLSDFSCDLPQINYQNYLGKKYRFFYAISLDFDANRPGGIIKIDAKTKTCKSWYEENCYVGEPIFVPCPDSKFEDDGVILASMLWGREDTNRVGLLVLKADSFEELGRAEFETGGPVPKCTHGMFLPTRK